MAMHSLETKPNSGKLMWKLKKFASKPRKGKKTLKMVREKENGINHRP